MLRIYPAHRMAEKMGKKGKGDGPVVLLIWDGFGLSKPSAGNAISQARMPNWKRLLRSCPNTSLISDGEEVGLPKGQVGNSEAGHMTIGAGRPIESDLVRINKEIRKNTFHDNPALLRAVAHVTRNQSTLHLMGLFTNTSSGHSYPKHLYALIRFAEELHLKRVVLHLFTDGRDTPPYHATKLLDELLPKLSDRFTIGSIIGRAFAMDRNRFWDRTERAYHALVGCEGFHAKTALQAIEQAYARGESDEYIQPTIICEATSCRNCISDNDAIVFWNLRSDRARQLTKPFAMPHFEQDLPKSFQRKMKRKNLFFVTLTEFGQHIDSIVPAYPSRTLDGTLVEALRMRRQVYMAESEKFAHVTYFFNGGFDQPRFGERRIKLATRRVSTYDERPRMRADDLAKRLIQEIERGAEFVCANFANADMVAHTGNLEATIRSCEALDDALGGIERAVRKAKGTLIVTSDHGNAETVMRSPGMVDTEHNSNPVPFVVMNSRVKRLKRYKDASLSDVAPTVLTLMNLPVPREMTGRSLVSRV